MTTCLMYLKVGIHWARKESKGQEHSRNTNKDFHQEPEAQRLAVLFKSEPLPVCLVMT